MIGQPILAGAFGKDHHRVLASNEAAAQAGQETMVAFQRTFHFWNQYEVCFPASQRRCCGNETCFSAH